MTWKQLTQYPHLKSSIFVAPTPQKTISFRDGFLFKAYSLYIDLK
ncbi:hypothetical protein JCM19314_1805 [Nonlabens ulvanivorans]|uniref:Uncharacterized protein n=1 Tax=Nonlabens ulvanivorans TaxID=906888 RepID=A0A090QEV0_NONUL|nr:hypothetical protein JCM19314_1805 [Nonlabens ulvanivorans]